MGRFAKPTEGSWTEHYPDLGTGLVDYTDCLPEFFALEREAIFMRSWLNVGRVEQLPRTGSYFTKELPVARTSVILVRDGEGEVRAFHNICRHRGNKLVWEDFPNEETSGTARQFTCKYHAWRYGLDGACTFVQQAGEFFDLEENEHDLVPVHCDTWAGFVFVYLGDDPPPLREFLGPMVTATEDYPFERLTERFRYRAVVPANWKLLIDALQEQYHAPIVHGSARPDAFKEEVPMQIGGFEAPHYQLDGPHRMMSTPGIKPWELPPAALKPSEKVLRSGLFGAWDEPDFHADTKVPGINPGNLETVGVSEYLIWPNFGLQFWERGWYHTYHHWPTAHDEHVFEWTMYFPPSRNASERLAHQVTATTLIEFAIQDDAMIVTIQDSLAAGVVTSFPLGDQEVLCRHLHHTARQWVDEYRSTQ
jgi:phenylpropionate dioxygenase-like ring-hydroxylating dioxygenase large terminal subunit